MPEFNHLQLHRVLENSSYLGVPAPRKKNPRTLHNLQNRKEHVDQLTSQLNGIRQQWAENIQARKDNDYPEVDVDNIIPVFLKIDVAAKDIESLKSFGIEIISEEEDGYVIGASVDNFKLFSDRLDQFLDQSNKKFKDSAASILEIAQDPTERLKRILSQDLFDKWEELDGINEIVVYVAISAYLKIPDYPTQGENQSDEKYAAAIERYKERYKEWQLAKDEIARQREILFETFTRAYRAEFLGILSPYTDFDDGFGCKIRISGRGLKDIAINYPYVFNIQEHDPLIPYKGVSENESLLDIVITSPDEDAPKICIIDSGIQEGHRLLQPAIDSAMSISYVPGDADAFDKVGGGGHGTRVAGATLYPDGLNDTTQLQAPFWLQNARILDNQNMISSRMDEADIMRIVVARFLPTKIFNLSVCNSKPVSYVHMPIWAATIDKLIWENDIMFVVSAGNIDSVTGDSTRPGITDFIKEGINYPTYQLSSRGNITNPAVSCFALTVGSVNKETFENDSYKSLAENDMPSSFSRGGPGLWGMIKPDVVEYGGDFVYDKADPSRIILLDGACPTLIRSTRDLGPAVGRDAVGTSFTAPKVSHLAAVLQRMYPRESCLLFQALIVQSAKLPAIAGGVNSFIRHYGYGIPVLEKATTNSERRVTLYSTDSINPKNTNIYCVRIPDEITRPGLDFDVLIEITLAYKAEPRLTRQKTRSYLSAWLDWEASKKGENEDTFTDRIKNTLTDEDDIDENEDDLPAEEIPLGGQQAIPFKWNIASRSNNGVIRGIKRQDNSIQKDWCIEKSNQLPSEFLLAVRGHKGWEKDIDKKVPYAITVSFEILDPEVNVNLYESIRIANEIQIATEVEIVVQ